MNFRIVVFFLLALCAISKSVCGQEPTPKVNDSTKNLKIRVLPVLFFLPETGLGYGGISIGTFRFKNESADSRPSTIQAAATLTSKKQILLFAPFEIYADEEKWRFVGEVGFYKYFYNFFGIGIDSREEDLETYDVTFSRARLTVLREIVPKFSVGLAYEFDKYGTPTLKEDGLIDAGDFLGKEGGIISNLGISTVYDSRDNIFFPTKGLFIQGNLLASFKAVGSDFSYNKWILDSRYYQKIKGRHVLATNLYFANNGEGAPFLDLNSLGSRRTRGFDNRRFQDNAEWSMALEYRFPLYRRIEGVAFGSTATVSKDFGSLFSSAFKNAAGIGLRYTLNKKEGTRIRMDYGISGEGGNFYFTINEAF
ncbi:BamA/TamA family outer membrane protein [Maribacter sp. 2307UL18-2]|uniref:BamA/TamA family outer membrane protein n=1 Tax=Maribacter sp. 2307UL18-2 TaxID=3386274 RepID=UPI0039BC4E4A